jgi:hypothetical protein
VAVAVAVLLAAGCGDGDDDDLSADPGTTTTSSSASEGSTTTTSAPTSSATTATSTTTTSTAPPTTMPFDGGTSRVEVPRPASTSATVHHTALEVTASGGEERVTFTFDGLPGVVVEYVDRPVRESGSGDEVEVDGGAVLSVRFEPAGGASVDGEQVTRTYAGPNRVPGAGGTVSELVRTGDFEALYEWAIGVTDEVPFRVEVDEPDTVTIVLPAG